MSVSTLVVFVPEQGSSPQFWTSLSCMLEAERHVRLRVYDPQARSMDATERCTDLAAFINEEWLARPGYTSLILVGHADGGVLVRGSYLIASGVFGDIRSEFQWARFVERIVLMGVFTRGLTSSRLIQWLPYAAIRSLVGRYVSDLFDDSEFIIKMQIAWVRHCARLENQSPAIAHLIGSMETQLAREQCADSERLPRTRIIEVPSCKNIDIPNINAAADPDGRRSLLRRAIFEPFPPDKPGCNLAAHKTIIFILHGIRSRNTGWVERTRQKLVAEDPNVEVIPSTYQYMSAFRFPFQLFRRDKTTWFQREYAYQVTKHPYATFHFIGHSYGTFILGHSLLRLSVMEFERLVLLGSVLPCAFPWRGILDKAQARHIRNDRSTCDVPVGIVCSALRFLRVGTAGIDGFTVADDRCQEVFYHPGGHSSALAEDNMNSVVSFILTGQTKFPWGHLSSDIPAWFGRLSRLAPYLALPLILLCAFTIYILAAILAATSGIPTWVTATVAVSGIVIILDTL